MIHPKLKDSATDYTDWHRGSFYLPNLSFGEKLIRPAVELRDNRRLQFAVAINALTNDGQAIIPELALGDVDAKALG